MTTSGVGSSASGNGVNTGGIDWAGLITAAVNAKEAPAVTYSNEITANGQKISAYQGLQTDLSTLASDLSALSTSDINPAATNLFAARSAQVSLTGNLDATSVLNIASIAAGTVTGDHTLQIGQLATAQKVIGAAQSASPLGLSGTFSLGLTGGSSASITVTSGMTLQDIQDAINTQTSTSNVAASIVQVSGGSFELMLSGTEDAADISYSATSGDDILNKLGVTDSTGAFLNVTQAAQSAEFTLDGVALTRNTNDISDVLSGVTFDLVQPTLNGAKVNISIGTNIAAISNAMQTFVTDYNKVRDDVLAQQAINADGTAASGAVLLGDGSVRDLMDQLQQALASNGSMMTELGLSFNSNNELTLDSNQLNTALTTNLSGVTAMLSAQTKTSSSELSVTHTGSSPQSFTLDVTVDSSGNLTGASVGGDNSLFVINGNQISGAKGTIYAGMSFTYSGTTSKSIAVTSTSGLAAQIAQIASTASGSNGAFATQINSLQTQNTALSQKVSDVDGAAMTFQSELETKYANYQTAIAAANNTLNYLTALLNQKSNS